MPFFCGLPGLLEDEVVVDGGAGGQADGRGGDDLRLKVGQVARDPDPGDRGGADGIGLDVGSDEVVAVPQLDGLEAERGQQLGASVHARRDDDRVESYLATVGQPDPGQAGGTGLDLFDPAFGHGDATGLELLALLAGQRRTGVPQQRHVRAELPEQQRLVDGGRAGGEDADALVPDLPAVAVRAVQDVDAPPGGESRHVGKLVAQARGEQQPAGHDCTRPDVHAEPVAVPAQGRDPSGLHPAAVPGHLGAPGRVDLPGRCAVPGEEVVHVPGRRVTRVPRVDHQDRTAGPGQRDRAAQPGCAAADHYHVIDLIHASTIIWAGIS